MIAAYVVLMAVLAASPELSSPASGESAQTQPLPQPQPEPPPDPPLGSGDPLPDTATPSSGSMSAGAGMTVAAGNQAPERDARGIPVVSDPATAPAGTNQMTPVPPGAQVQMGGSGAFATQASTDNYPGCSRTVTDNCVQSYERGARPRTP